jgi:PAS domain S-box-containing protein
MVKSMLSPDGKKRFAKLEESFAEGIFPHDVDLPILTKEGVRRVLNVSFSSVLREEHSLIVTMRDVTEERSMARELTRTKEFLQRVIDSSVDAIVSADMKGQVLLFNPAAEDIYGYFAEEVLGNMNVSDLYPTGVAHRIMQLIRSESQGGAGVLRGFETELLGKDGRLIPVMLSAALIVHRGRPIGSVGVFKDLRAERSFVRRLEAAQKELEAQEKNAFIAELAGATAHELNQPLTTVMGYAGMLERQLAQLEGQPRLKKASTAIVRETERMAEIVRKIGKLTKYESKSYVSETKIIDIERSIDSDPHVNGL